MISTGLPRICLRLALAWAGLSLLGLATGEHLVSFLLPFFSDIINAMSSSYVHSLNTVEQNGTPLIEIKATLVEPIRAASTIVIPPGKSFSATVYTWHVLVPVIIIYSLLIAWPVTYFRQRLQILLLGILTAMLLLAFTIPALLAGHIEAQLISLIQKVGGHPDVPFILDWVIFVELGGRWLLPIIGATGCVALSSSIDQLYDRYQVTGNCKFHRPAPRKTRREKKMEKRIRTREKLAGSGV